MTQSNPLLIRLAGKVAARDLTRAVYSGLLERDPDEEGVDAYLPLFEQGGHLADVIKCVASSTEFRERFMRQLAGDLLCAVYQGVLHRDPTAEELAGAMSSTADLAELLKTVSGSEEHWQKQIERHAERLAHELADMFQADMRSGGADAPAMLAGSAADRVVQRISSVTQTEEYVAAVFSRHAAAVLDDIYSALLGRSSDPEGFAIYKDKLQSPCDIGSVVEIVADSEEHWRLQLRQRAGELTRAVFQGILHRDPTSDELPGAMSSTADLAERLRSLCASEEHWQAQFERHAERLACDLADRLEAEMRGGRADVPVSVSRSAADRVVRRLSSVAQTEEYGAALFRRRAASVVDDVYSALLGRLADPNGSAIYTEMLQDPSDIGSVVKKIAESEEHWQHLLHNHTVELIDLAYQRLIRRPATPEDLASGVEKGVGTVLETLAQSDELWHLQLWQRGATLANGVADALDTHTQELDQAGLAPGDADAFTMAFAERIRSITESDQYFSSLVSRRSEALLDIVYRALLNRGVDAEGLTAYVQEIRGPADIGRVIRQISMSPEYKHRLKVSNFFDVAAPTPAAVAINHVEELFQKFAGRAASALEVSRCLAHGEQVGRATPSVLREFVLGRDARERKVLLFGAYGNGNMGDAYQAIALQKHLMETWGLNESQIFATSMACSADFPFPSAQRLPPETILDTRVVNGFDCLIIGGGGLIGHPHEPLFDAEWISRVHTPMLLLAVGAGSATAEMHRALLERAWVVSGRDDSSVAELRRIREDAFLIRDPILTSGNVAKLIKLDAARPRGAAKKSAGNVLWILKYPASRKDIGFLNKVAQLIRKQKKARHCVVGIEPARDQALEQFLPGQIQYLSSLSDLKPLIETARVVVSMRYHGCIFAALAGKPSIGYSQSKIKALYAEMSIPGYYETAFDHLEELISSPEIIVSRDCPLDAMQSAFCSQLKMVGSLTLIGDLRASLPRPE